MSYVRDKVLTGSEKTVKEIAKNKVYLVLAWVWGVLGCWLLLIPTIIAIKKTFIFVNTEYVVTDTKVIEKYGVFNIHIDEMPFTKMENITVECPFWGRIFNYGDVIIQGANTNNICFTGVKSPYDVKKELVQISQI